MKHVLLAWSMLLVLASCDVTIGDIDSITASPSVIGPLAKTTIKLEDIEDITYFEGSYQWDLGVTDPVGNTITIPAKSNETVSSEIEDTDDFFNSGTIDSLGLSFEFTNTFDIAINSGAKIVIESKSGTTTNTIFTQTLPALSPGQSFTLDKVIADVNVEDEIVFHIEDFSTPGGTITVSNTNTVIDVDYQIDVIKGGSLSLNKNKTHEFDTDTIDFELFSEDEELDLDGKLNLFVENNFPASFEIDIQLLDENEQPLTGLFDNTVVIDAPSDSQISSNGFSKQSFIPVKTVDAAEYELLKKAKYAVVSGELSTPNGSSATYEMDENSYLNLLIALDATIKIEE